MKSEDTETWKYENMCFYRYAWKHVLLPICMKICTFTDSMINYHFLWNQLFPALPDRLRVSGITMWGIGGLGTPTYVQTNLEISVKLQKSLFLYIGVGVPCMYIVTFYTAHQSSNEKLFWSPTFYGCLGRCCAGWITAIIVFLKILVATSFPKVCRFRRLFRLCRLLHTFLADGFTCLWSRFCPLLHQLLYGLCGWPSET